MPGSQKQSLDFESILKILKSQKEHQCTELRAKLGLGFFSFLGNLDDYEEIKIFDLLQRTIKLTQDVAGCINLMLQTRAMQRQYSGLSRFGIVVDYTVDLCVRYIAANMELIDFVDFVKSLNNIERNLIKNEIIKIQAVLVGNYLDEALKKMNYELESGNVLTLSRDQYDYYKKIIKTVLAFGDKYNFAVLCTWCLRFQRLMLLLAKECFLPLTPDHLLYSIAMETLAKLYAFSEVKGSKEKEERRIIKALACATEWVNSSRLHGISVEMLEAQQRYILGFYRRLIFSTQKFHSLQEVETKQPYDFLRVQFELYAEKRKLNLPADKLYIEIMKLMSSLREKCKPEGFAVDCFDIFLQAVKTQDDPITLGEVIVEAYKAFINIFNHPICKALEAENEEKVTQLFAQIKKENLPVDLAGKNAEQQFLLDCLVKKKKYFAICWLINFYIEGSIKLSDVISEKSMQAILQSNNFSEENQKKLRDLFYEDQTSISETPSWAPHP